MATSSSSTADATPTNGLNENMVRLFKYKMQQVFFSFALQIVPNLENEKHYAFFEIPPCSLLYDDFSKNNMWSFQEIAKVLQHQDGLLKIAEESHDRETIYQMMRIADYLQKEEVIVSLYKEISPKNPHLTLDLLVMLNSRSIMSTLCSIWIKDISNQKTQDHFKALINHCLHKNSFIALQSIIDCLKDGNFLLIGQALRDSNKKYWDKKTIAFIKQNNLQDLAGVLWQIVYLDDTYFQEAINVKVIFPDKKYKNGESLLHLVFQMASRPDEDEMMLERLFRAGFAINAPSHKEITPLMIALKRGKSNVASVLIKNYMVPLNVPNNMGIYPFHFAVTLQTHQIFASDPICYALTDKLGHSILHYCIAANASCQMIRRLLARPECNPQIKSSLGLDALKLVCTDASKVPLLDLICGTGATIEEKKAMLELFLPHYDLPEILTEEDDACRKENLLHFIFKQTNHVLIQTICDKLFASQSELVKNRNIDVFCDALSKRNAFGQTPIDLCVESNPLCFDIFLQIAKLAESLGSQKLNEVLMPTSSFMKAMVIQFLTRSMTKKEDTTKLTKLFQGMQQLYVAKSRQLHRDAQVFEQDCIEFMTTILERCIDLSISEQLTCYVFKTNPTLPVNKESCEKVLALITPLKGEVRTACFLALQTHHSLAEIEKLFQNKEPLPHICSKDEFFTKSEELQEHILLYSAIFRARASIPIANAVIKRATSEGIQNVSFVRLSLLILQKTGVSASHKVLQRIQKLCMQEEMRKEAILALTQVENDYASQDRMHFLLDLLEKEQKHPTSTLQYILESLSNYNLENTKEIEKRIVQMYLFFNNLSHPSVKNIDVYRGFCSCFLKIASLKSLSMAYSIIMKEIWDEIENKHAFANLLEHIGTFDLLPFRPAFHESRDSIMRIIAEKVLNFYQEVIQEEIEENYSAFLQNPSHPIYKDTFTYSMLLAQVKSSRRFIGLPIQMPKNSVVYRGLSNRKRKIFVKKSAFVDLLLKGCGSCDLTEIKKHDGASWSKIGYIFSSASLDYVLGGYFDEEGVLIAIDTEFLNKTLLEGSARLQKEKNLHLVNYKTIPHNAIRNIFVSNIYKQEIENILQDKNITWQKETQKDCTYAFKTLPYALRKYIHRSLQKTDQTGKSLKEKIVYFERSHFSVSEIKDLLHKQGLPTNDLITQINEESIKRHIGRSLLSQIPSFFEHYPDLLECITYSLCYSPVIDQTCKYESSFFDESTSIPQVFGANELKAMSYVVHDQITPQNVAPFDVFKKVPPIEYSLPIQTKNSFARHAKPSPQIAASHLPINVASSRVPLPHQLQAPFFYPGKPSPQTTAPHFVLNNILPTIGPMPHHPQAPSARHAQLPSQSAAPQRKKQKTVHPNDPSAYLNVVDQSFKKMISEERLPSIAGLPYQQMKAMPNTRGVDSQGRKITIWQNTQEIICGKFGGFGLKTALEIKGAFRNKARKILRIAALFRNAGKTVSKSKDYDESSIELLHRAFEMNDFKIQTGFDELDLSIASFLLKNRSLVYESHASKTDKRPNSIILKEKLAVLLQGFPTTLHNPIFKMLISFWLADCSTLSSVNQKNRNIYFPLFQKLANLSHNDLDWVDTLHTDLRNSREK